MVPMISWEIYLAIFQQTQTFYKYVAVSWVWPPHSNSDHQDYYIFNRESL